MKTPAHFFDLGGTLLALDDHNEIALDEHGRVAILPGVREHLAALAGTPVFVVSNQSGLAAETLDTFRAQLTAGTGDTITGYAICTHPRDAGCGCRKPRPGLVLSLAETHRIHLAGSTMVGDTETDRQLAMNAGIGHFAWAADYFRTSPATSPGSVEPADHRVAGFGRCGEEGADEGRRRTEGPRRQR